MKQQFETFSFGAEVQIRIMLASQILAEYAALGYTLTIRQLYYQMVARGHIENTMRSYKRIVDTMTKARLAGLIDWNAIEDRTRSTMRPRAWANEGEIIDVAKRAFRLDRWLGQKQHVEVFIEKEALSGVFEPLVEELDINVTANRGYTSASEMFRHALRMRSLHVLDHKELTILYFGDHDPSGLDMDRDIKERLGLLSFGVPFHFQRLALTWDQIEEHQPPPNPAKLTDSRAAGYVDEYGDDSWELDALSPTLLTQLVSQAVLPLRDDELYDAVLALEDDMSARLDELSSGEDEYYEEEFSERYEALKRGEVA